MGLPVVVRALMRPPVAGVVATTKSLLIIERAVELVEELIDNRSVSIEDIEDMILKFPS
jgi:hypothetical protein